MTIRKNDASPCPFGLKITFACDNAGDTITRMAPLEVLGDKASEDEKKQVALANARILIWDKPCERCKFAGKVFDSKDAVECNFGTEESGTSKGLLGSPFYSKVNDNIALDGLYNSPLGYYDANISSNLYYGIQSVQSSEEDKDIEKLAKKETDEKK